MFVAPRARAEWYRTSRMSRCPCPVSDGPMARDRRCMRSAIDEINVLPDQRCGQCAACFRREIQLVKIIAGQVGEDGSD
jgi:hypothetical protein